MWCALDDFLKMYNTELCNFLTKEYDIYFLNSLVCYKMQTQRFVEPLRGLSQTVQTHIRQRIMRCLIWVFTACLHNFLLKFGKMKKKLPRSLILEGFSY